MWLVKWRLCPDGASPLLAAEWPGQWWGWGHRRSVDLTQDQCHLSSSPLHSGNRGAGQSLAHQHQHCKHIFSPYMIIWWLDPSSLHMLPNISSVTKVHCSGNAREHFDPIYESLFLKHSVDVKQKTCPWHILPCRQRQPWCRGGWCWEGAGSQITVGRWKTRRSGQREEAIRSCNVVTVLPEPGLAMADGPLQHQSGVVTGSHIKHLICPAPPSPHNPAQHIEKRSIGWNILKRSGKWIQIKCLLVFFLILHNILEYIP